MVNMIDIPIDQNNNHLLFKNYVEYKQAVFMQAYKMSKRLINMFLTILTQHLYNKTEITKMRIK